MNEKNLLTIELIPEFIILGLQDCNFHSKFMDLYRDALLQNIIGVGNEIFILTEPFMHM
jgi:hypothetical protein